MEGKDFTPAEFLIAGLAILLGIIIAAPNFVIGTHDDFTAVSAIRGIINIQSAQNEYRQRSGKYASALRELGPQSAELIPADLAAGKKNGYVYSLLTTQSGYQIEVHPDVFGEANKCRTFYSDQTQIIRENRGREPATAQSEALR